MVDISGCRLVFGVEAAWQENEHRAYGIPCHTTADRLRRLGEACLVILNLSTNENTTLEGRYYQLKDARLSPKPMQRPRPPLLIGGGERVTMRIAAKYIGEWNVAGTPQHFAQKTKELDRRCASIGRDAYDIRRSAHLMVSVTDTPSLLVDYSNVRLPVISGNAQELRRLVQEFQDAGADELVIAPLSKGDAQRERDLYDRFMHEVIPWFR